MIILRFNGTWFYVAWGVTGLGLGGSSDPRSKKLFQNQALFLRIKISMYKKTQAAHYVCILFPVWIKQDIKPLIFSYLVSVSVKSCAFVSNNNVCILF